MLARLKVIICWAKDVSRWDEWATSKIPLLLACIYYALITKSNGGSEQLAESAQLAFTLCVYAMFGYMVNSWSDRVIDSAAGKWSPMAQMGSARSGFLVLGVFAFGAGLTFMFYHDRLDVLVLFAVSYALAAGYSLPLIRLKELGLAGLLASAIAQRALPAVIVFQSFGAWDQGAIALCLLGGMVGLRYIVVHQILDAASDSATGVRTVATVRGLDWLKSLQVRVFFPAEVLLLLVFQVANFPRWPFISFAAIFYAISCIVSYCALPEDQDDWMSPVSYRVFADYYNFFLPTVSAVFLAIMYPSLWLIPLFTLVWLSGEFRQQVQILTKVLK